MRQRGQAVIQTIGLMFVTLMVGAFAVDAGLYFFVHRAEQNAADAAALAAVNEFYRTSTNNLSTRQSAALTAAQNLASQNYNQQLNSTDVEFGYVDPISGNYNSANFLTTSTDPAFAHTGGYNAVRVTVKAGAGQANNPIPGLFANYLGMSNFQSQAQAVAIWGGGVQSASGLRPIYMCQAGWDKAEALFGDPTIPEITFYGDTLNVGGVNVNASNSCGNLGPGNWGLADLDNGNGAPGASQVNDWFANGYNGQVSVGQWYESQPGNSIHSYHSALNQLKTSQTVITIPLYNQTTGNGSTAKYQVSRIAAFVITDFQTTGKNRWIKGYFKKITCHANCTLGGQVQGGGLTKLRLVH